MILGQEYNREDIEVKLETDPEAAPLAQKLQLVPYH